MKRFFVIFIFLAFFAPMAVYANEKIINAKEDQLPDEVTSETVIEEELFFIRDGGAKVVSSAEDDKIQAKLMKLALSASNCQVANGDISLDKDCDGETTTVFTKKIIDHDLSVFTAGGFDPDRRFSRYGLGGLQYLGAWNFSKNFSFLFGSVVAFTPIQGAGDQFYVELNRKNKGIIDLLIGGRLAQSIAELDVLMGVSVAHSIEFNSIPLRIHLSLLPGDFVISYLGNFDFLNKDFDNHSNTVEALYRIKFVRFGISGSFLNSKEENYIWQWGFASELIAQYYFSNHIASNTVGKDWGSIRFQGGRSSFAKWIGRTEVQFKF